VVNPKGGQIVLFDTPGIHKPMHRMNERMVATAVATLAHVDLVVWIVDLGESFGPGDRYVSEVLRKSGRPVLLAINKIDTAPRPSILPVIDRLKDVMPFVDIVPISALKGDNVDVLVERMLAHLPEGAALYPEEFLTDLPERFFVAEMVREQILHLTRQEIPYSSGVVIESFKEEEGLVRIHAAVLVERDSQKAIVIGRGGSMLKAIGTAARKEIESFLGAKVFLGLFVKVREKWREDARALDEMGLADHRDGER
jgi:GTP-binding protein Era